MRRQLYTPEIRRAAERLIKESAEEGDLPLCEQSGAYVLALEIVCDLFRMHEQEAANYVPQVLQAARLFGFEPPALPKRSPPVLRRRFRK